MPVNAIFIAKISEIFSCIVLAKTKFEKLNIFMKHLNIIYITNNYVEHNN